jgi:hypothetical protein
MPDAADTTPTQTTSEDAAASAALVDTSTPAPAADVAAAADPAPAPADDTSTVLGGEEKPADEAQSAQVAPEAYELKAPEGQELDTEALAAAEPVFRDLNLTNEQAQKLTDAYTQILPKVVERMQAQQSTMIADQRKAWADEAKADPEIGGKNWDASIASSAKALDRLGAPAGSPFRQLLNDSGLGNHPEMIRMFAKIGNVVGEDGDFIAAKTTQAKTTEEKFYGKSA